MLVAACIILRSDYCRKQAVVCFSVTIATDIFILKSHIVTMETSLYGDFEGHVTCRSLIKLQAKY